ncbi:hypothetical protein AX289_25125 [Methylorubrum populi]|nr:hypothetical protein AX289_25125 [Methylorubrum populi]
MPEYFLVDDGNRMPRWCEFGHAEDRSFWVDFKARRIPYDEGRPLAVVEAENPAALLNRRPPEIAALEREHALRLLLDPWSNQGWLSPDGRFYGCRFFAHDELAHSLLGKHVGELEEAGWIRVHADSFRSSPIFRRETTARQAATLAALGFADVDAPGGRRIWIQPSRDAPPPRYAYRPAAAEASPPASPPGLEVPERPDAEEAFLSLAVRLEASELLAGLFSRERTLVADVGPGRWLWMFEFPDVSVGSDETPEALSVAAGLHLHAVAFDQLEISAWPFAGIDASDAARRLLGSLPTSGPRPGP